MSLYLLFFIWCRPVCPISFFFSSFNLFYLHCNLHIYFLQASLFIVPSSSFLMSPYFMYFSSSIVSSLIFLFLSQPTSCFKCLQSRKQMPIIYFNVNWLDQFYQTIFCPVHNIYYCCAMSRAKETWYITLPET